MFREEVQHKSHIGKQCIAKILQEAQSITFDKRIFTTPVKFSSHVVSKPGFDCQIVLFSLAVFCSKLTVHIRTDFHEHLKSYHCFTSIDPNQGLDTAFDFSAKIIVECLLSNQVWKI